MKVQPTQQIIFFRECPTKVVGNKVQVPASTGEAIAISGGPNQKQIAISNGQTVAVINIYELEGGPIIAKVFPGTSWTLVTSGVIFVKASGVTFEAYVAKTIYTNELP